jgi:hypothetical protein
VIPPVAACFSEGWDEGRIVEELVSIESHPGGPFEEVCRWLENGMGLAVYQDVEHVPPQAGQLAFVSFGNAEALLRTDSPPEWMPGFGGRSGGQFLLQAIFRGRALNAEMAWTPDANTRWQRLG